MHNHHQILEMALDKLTVVVNVSTGLAHPLDKARAQELFQALRGKGVPLEHDAVHACALRLGWPDRHAQALADLAHSIHAGAICTIEHTRGWGQPVVDALFDSQP